MSFNFFYGNLIWFYNILPMFPLLVRSLFWVNMPVFYPKKLNSFCTNLTRWATSTSLALLVSFSNSVSFHLAFTTLPYYKWNSWEICKIPYIYINMNILSQYEHWGADKSNVSEVECLYWWQIEDVLSDAGTLPGIKSVCLYGGTSKGPQISSLKSGVVSSWEICSLYVYVHCNFFRVTKMPFMPFEI